MASAYFKLRILRKKRNALENKNEECGTVIKKATNINVGSTQCRICLLQGAIPIFGDGTLSEVPEYIRLFGDIELSEDDDYPKYLCNVCHSLLQNAISFRKKAKQTDLMLKQNLNSKLSTTYEGLDLHEDYNYTSDDDIKNIGMSHNEVQKSYHCKSCSLKFKSWSEYLAHKNSKEHKNVRVQCPICFGLLTSQLFKRHLARHQSASHLICDVCGKLYRKDNLVRHLQLHSFDLPYQCQVCPYRGRFMESLKIHMRSHTGDKPFSCDKCELRFLTRSNLNRHLLTHKKERPFKCVECGRGFYAQRDLDMHFKADHAGIKDFGCRMCGNKYGSRKALMRHELRVHKRDKLAKGRMPLYLQADYRRQSQ